MRTSAAEAAVPLRMPLFRGTPQGGAHLDGMADHIVRQSLYLRDPDGNEVELFVDDPAYDWRSDDRWMAAPVKPLQLDGMRIFTPDAVGHIAYLCTP